MNKLFQDRNEAASLLVARLKEIKISDGIVLAIPRGGVPIGFVIATELHLPLDLVMSKKIGHPLNEEFAIGSVTLNDLVLNDTAANLPEAYVSSEVKRIRESLQKKYSQLSGGGKPFPLKGKDVIIVDDGLATGSTMLACIDDIRKQFPNSIIVAVPVSSRSAAVKIRSWVDKFICLNTPWDFFAVGEFYQDFSEVPDQIVMDLLASSKASLLRL